MLIRRVTQDDTEECHFIEASCFEESEAASIESIYTRIYQYPQGFLVAEKDNRIIGMLNSGSTDSDDLTDEDFKKLIGHKENGENSVVFSLSVLPDYQGNGIASRLMTEFISKAVIMKKKKILLLCKSNLILFYEHFGFHNCGLSQSEHGGFKWYEMRHNLV